MNQEDGSKQRSSDEVDRQRLAAFGLLAIVSSRCIGPDRLPVMCGNRAEPENVSDSGWMLYSGEESPEFNSNPDNFKLVPLNRMIDTDPTLAALLDFPEGTEMTRRSVSEPWRFIVGDRVVDADGNVTGEIQS